MNKNTILGIIAVLAIAGIAYYIYTAKPAAAPTTKENSNSSGTFSPTTINGKPAPGPQEGAAMVIIDKGAFVPANLTVKVGSVVTFKNVDTAAHWPASDPHPVHTLCPGFDAKKGLLTGEIYSFTFTEVKTCTYHDHLHPSAKGTITVTK